MNIFVLDSDPVAAARNLCDKHVVKMLVESAQMLSTISAENGGIAPYRPTHLNHPCTRWVAKSKANWDWLVSHATEMAHEYSRRYCNRVHKSSLVIDDLRHNGAAPTQGSLTGFVLAMPEQWKCDDPITAYRAFYIAEKSQFARWNNGTPPPSWWPKELL